jgi:Ca2+-binding EF-hand superfamily protein
MKNEEFLCRTLDFGEFLLLLASHQTEEQDDYDELNFAFQLFDIGIRFNIFFFNFQFFYFCFKEGREYIDLNILRRINEQTGLNLSELELQLMFQEADRNGDARIDRHEFVRIMRQTNLFSR